MQPTGQQLTQNVVHLLALFSQKEHFFVWLLVSQLTGQHLCAVYKFSFTGGLI